MLRYALYDIRASILSTDRFFFGVALPIVFFLLFGAMQDYSSQPMGDGNVAAYVIQSGRHSKRPEPRGSQPWRQAAKPELDTQSGQRLVDFAD